MTLRHCSQLLFATALVLPCLSAWSQDLTLFQDDRLDNARSQVSVGAGPAGAPPVVPGSLALVLKGIYRFGNEYHVSLQVADGAAQTVTWQDDDDAAVSVASGYLIEQVSPREVTFDMPAGINCEQSALGGASCVGRSQMVLTFSETAAASAQGPDTPGGQQNGVSIEAGQGGRFGRGGGNDIGALFDAANAGDEEAAAALEEFLGNRGTGGRGGGGGRGGAGGGRGGAGGGRGGGDGVAPPVQ